MDKSPNWCPDCEKETEWLVVPSNPRFVQCKECGNIKENPLRVEKPPLEEKPKTPSLKRIVDRGMAVQVAVQSVIGAFLVGGIWLVLAFLFMTYGEPVSAIIFFILFFATASTVQIYSFYLQVRK